ncbi:hypothetical protein GCM10028803_00110 [Larkinella knui]|uniref:Uncharacterized protein n=1 Tax=Larkinella knui TaxID=2025310 RepID=A0A3P1CJI6_9BACT|nr:hypothetical protein [Larkinella knui]RRB13419.1 hypothetical protein EHT87_14175 [Larkinella knui]
MQQPNLFHNTSDLTGQDLKEVTAQAQSQTQAVLNFFKKYPGMLFMPSEVHQKMVNLKLINWRTPIQSIRRALTYLTRRGDLIKTPRKKAGSFGARHPEYCWTLNQPAQ